jgi:uncharacterized protein (TIGR00299 family) protein
MRKEIGSCTLSIRMKIAYLDCFSGISGDMVLGALVDASVSFEHLEAELRRLPVPGWSIRAEEVKRRGLRAKKVTVESSEHHPHRDLQEILAMIAAAGFAPGVTDRATRIFTRLGEAEAAIHGVPVERIHFHEVGALDSIVDIVGAAIGFEALNIEQIFCSPLNVGGGRVQTSHGILPVPAPATAALLQGAPTYSSGLEMELVTPTGAAIVATLAKGFGAQPPMRVESTGYGAGAADPKEQANVLRMFVGEALEEAHAGETGPYWEPPIAVLEANVDDMNPQIYGYFAERALAAGALDVFAAPVQMKKGRPGLLVTVLCQNSLRDAMSEMLLRETTTIGVRVHEVRRRILDRETVTVRTDFGDVRLKVSRGGGDTMNVSPEYEDCRKIAAANNIPLKEVMAEALRAFQSGEGKLK